MNNEEKRNVVFCRCSVKFLHEFLNEIYKEKESVIDVELFSIISKGLAGRIINSINGNEYSRCSCNVIFDRITLPTLINDAKILYFNNFERNQIMLKKTRIIRESSVGLFRIFDEMVDSICELLLDLSDSNMIMELLDNIIISYDNMINNKADVIHSFYTKDDSKKNIIKPKFKSYEEWYDYDGESNLVIYMTNMLITNERISYHIDKLRRKISNFSSEKFLKSVCENYINDFSINVHDNFRKECHVDYMIEGISKFTGDEKPFICHKLDHYEHMSMFEIRSRHNLIDYAIDKLDEVSDSKNDITILSMPFGIIDCHNILYCYESGNELLHFSELPPEYYFHKIKEINVYNNKQGEPEIKIIISKEFAGKIKHRITVYDFLNLIPVGDVNYKKLDKTIYYQVEDRNHNINILHDLQIISISIRNNEITMFGTTDNIIDSKLFGKTINDFNLICDELSSCIDIIPYSGFYPYRTRQFICKEAASICLRYHDYDENETSTLSLLDYVRSECRNSNFLKRLCSLFV